MFVLERTLFAGDCWFLGYRCNFVSSAKMETRTLRCCYCAICPESALSAYFLTVDECKLVKHLIFFSVFPFFPLLKCSISVHRNVKAVVAKCNHTQQVVAAQT